MTNTVGHFECEVCPSQKKGNGAQIWASEVSHSFYFLLVSSGSSKYYRVAALFTSESLFKRVMKKRRPHSRPGTHDLRDAAAAIEGFPSDFLIHLSLALTNLKSSCAGLQDTHIICPRLTQVRRRHSRLRRLLPLKGFVLKGRDGILLPEQWTAGTFLIWIL